MRHLAALLLASALVLSSSCAHTPPIVNDVVTCGGHTVQPADVTEAYTDLTTQNWPDLVEEGVRLGWDVVACVIDDLTAAHPELKPAGAKFKSDHAEQIKKANAPSVSLRGPTLQKVDQASNAAPPAPLAVSTGRRAGGSAADEKLGSRDPAGGQFTYAGETVDHAAKRGVAACGPGAESVGSPGQRCLCRNLARVWVSSR